MASSENHTAEGENHEDQEAQELFESFMSITKDAESQDESDGAAMEKSDENTIKEDCPSTTNSTPESSKLAQETEKESIEHQEDGFASEQSNSELSANKEDDSSITKRLSKAVDELSDLEKQLSLMISTGNVNPNNANQKESEETDKDVSVGNVNPNNANQKESEETDKDVCVVASEAQEKAANCEGKDNILESSENQSDSGSVEVAETSKGPTDDANLKVESNTEDGTLMQDNENNLNHGDLKIHQLSTDTTETEEKDQQKPTLSDQSAEDKIKMEATQVETKSKEVNEGSSLLTGNESEEIVKNNDPETEQGTIRKTSENSTIESNPTVDDQGKSVQEDGFSVTDTQKECKQGVTADVDDGTDSSTPEIEILMTDESGISERKSLESLDTDLDDIRPDSPALSDEGIDSDAKSLGDLDDDNDTTFDSGSMSDLTLFKGKFLQVDRNRVGSDSSTVSEVEFRTSMSHKSDNEESGKVYQKGYLLKLGGSGLTPRNWRKRWFVLKEDNCLYYYKNSKDKVPCGVIVLFDYSITKAPDSSKKYCFKLNKGGARTYHLCAANDDDMREWMVALMNAASAVSASGTSFQILEGNVHNVSIPALSIKDPECHGYLSKKGHNIKSWKRRYCVLKNGYLYYYSDMSNTTALGVAKLIGYQIKSGETRGKHYSFYGSPPDESMRVYHFAAETEIDRERWMTRMEESIGKGTTVQQ